MTKNEYQQRYMEDVNAHKSAEQIVLEVLNNLNNGFTFEDVSDDDKYFSRGDISVKVSTGPAQRKKGAQKRPCKQTVLQGQGVFTQS